MEPYLEIDKDEWSYIRENFSREDIQYSLAVITEEYPIPYREITRKEAIEDFLKLKSLYSHDLVFDSGWYTKRDYEWEFSNLCVSQKNAGNLCSDFFHQENRWKVPHARNPSPYESWNDFEKRRTLMGAAITLEMEKIDKTALRSMIGLRKYICDQFKPSIAKVLYDYFDAENILDFSAGWGDRLAGFYASDSAKSYVGIDPKKDNHEKYRNQVEFYEEILESRNKFFEIPNKDSDFICSPAEDADLSSYEESVDFILTSPPYFDLERYSEDENQSWVRYGDSIDSWLEGFLFPAIENVWGTLEFGGDMIINVSDAYSSGDWREICDLMNEFIDSLDGSEYQGAIGFELTPRPQVKERFPEEELEGKKYCEPAWHWRKE